MLVVKLCRSAKHSLIQAPEHPVASSIQMSLLIHCDALEKFARLIGRSLPVFTGICSDTTVTVRRLSEVLARSHSMLDQHTRPVTIRFDWFSKSGLHAIRIPLDRQIDRQTGLMALPDELFGGKSPINRLLTVKR